MIRLIVGALAALVLLTQLSGCATVEPAAAGSRDPDVRLLAIASGDLSLKGVLWKPAGPGPFPAVIYNHGSERYHDVHVALVGAMFAKAGYVMFAPYRRGQGLSADQGTWVRDVLDRIGREQGFQARGKMVVQLLRTEQFDDVKAGLERLRSLPFVDRDRIAMVGNSFGGILTMQAAEQGLGLRAAVNMAGAALNWKGSPDVREWMLEMARNARVPVYFIQAENDHDTAPSKALAAEMQRLGKPHRLRIFPAFGGSAEDGHTFGYLAPHLWGASVVEFLDASMRRAR